MSALMPRSARRRFQSVATLVFASLVWPSGTEAQVMGSPSQPPPEEAVGNGKADTPGNPPHLETVKLIFQAMNVMIPVVTGFLVLFVGSIGKLWHIHRSDNKIRIAWKTASIVVLISRTCLGVLGRCSGVRYQVHVGYAAGFPFLPKHL